MGTRVPLLRPFEEVDEEEAEAAGVEEGEGSDTTPEGIWTLLVSLSVARGQVGGRIACRIGGLLVTRRSES